MVGHPPWYKMPSGALRLHPKFASFPPSCPPTYRRLSRLCLSLDMAMRPDFGMVARCLEEMLAAWEAGLVAGGGEGAEPETAALARADTGAGSVEVRVVGSTGPGEAQGAEAGAGQGAAPREAAGVREAAGLVTGGGEGAGVDAAGGMPDGGCPAGTSAAQQLLPQVQLPDTYARVPSGAIM